MKYNTIHVDNKIFLVTNEKNIQPNDWYLFLLDKWELMQCVDKEESDRCNSHYLISKSCVKIVAAYPKIDGLYEFDKLPPHMDTEYVAEQYIINGKDFEAEGYSSYQNGKLNGFIDGYTQAKSETMFSLEDIKTAIHFGEMNTKDSSKVLFERKGKVLSDVTKTFIDNLLDKKVTKYKFEPEIYLDNELIIEDNKIKGNWI